MGWNPIAANVTLGKQELLITVIQKSVRNTNVDI